MGSYCRCTTQSFYEPISGAILNWHSPESEFGMPLLSRRTLVTNSTDLINFGLGGVGQNVSWDKAGHLMLIFVCQKIGDQPMMML